MSGTNNLSIGMLANICVLFGVSTAHGQMAEPEHFAYRVGGWELVEITDANDAVMGFWGIPHVDVEVGNIRRLWFEALPDEEWEVWAFEPVTIGEKAAALERAGADATSLEFLYYRESMAAADASNLDVDGGVEGPVTKGFIAGDPLTESTASMEDPESMIDVLADQGYAVAPGMSEMLVSGTAGTSVNMNQATKELLNCLRSTTNSCNNECVCTRAEVLMTPGPWTVIETPMDGGQLRCEYSRVEEHGYWQWGEYPDGCAVCDAGTPEDPIEFEVTVEHTDYWYDRENCPDEPVLYP